MSARDRKVEGHWDTLDKSSSTASSCRLSWIVPGSCRAMTIALVLSARSILWRQRSRAWLTSCRALDTPHGACGGTLDHMNAKVISLGEGVHLSSTDHRLVVVLAHGDRLLGRHHVPQTIASQHDVAVFFGVEGHHASVWLGRNYELPAVEVIAPKISCWRKHRLINTPADQDKQSPLFS